MKKLVFLFLTAFLINPSFIEGHYSIGAGNLTGQNNLPDRMILAFNEEIKSDSTAVNDSLRYAFAGTAASEPKHQLPEQKEEGTSFSTNFLYFIGAAAVATIIYIVWPEKDQETKTKTTFGSPVQPK